jgi:hypothetical protein
VRCLEWFDNMLHLCFPCWLEILLLPALGCLQLKRFEHEGDWSRALLSYDLVLQHLLTGSSGKGGSTGGAAGATQQLALQQAAGGGAAAAAGASLAAPHAGASFEGISQQAAVAGLVRSLSQLGAGHLLHAYAQSPAVADTAAAQAALSLGHWGQLTSGPTDSSGGAPAGRFSADAALSAAVAGLQAGSMERCKQAVSGARRGLVAGLVTASLEGAANINPALVQLQMLQGVSEAWELLWPAMPDLGSIGSPAKKRRRHSNNDSVGPGGSGAAAAAAAVVTAPNGGSLLENVLQLWRGREAAAGAGGRYNLQSPLQSMHQQLLHSLGAPNKQAGSLVQAAVSARTTGGWAGWVSESRKAGLGLLIHHQIKLNLERHVFSPETLPTSVLLCDCRPLCPGHHQPLQAAWAAAAAGAAFCLGPGHVSAGC